MLTHKRTRGISVNLGLDVWVDETAWNWGPAHLPGRQLPVQEAQPSQLTRCLVSNGVGSYPCYDGSNMRNPRALFNIPPVLSREAGQVAQRYIADCGEQKQPCIGCG